jgi:hypothetical protein
MEVAHLAAIPVYVKNANREETCTVLAIAWFADPVPKGVSSLSPEEEYEEQTS